MKANGVETHRFPDELLEKLHESSNQTLGEICSKDEFSLRVLKSYIDFLERMRKWGPMSSSAIWKWRHS